MSTKNYPEFVADVCSSPYESLRRYKADGKKVFGYTCSYVIEEILDAAGYIPIRMLGRAQNIQKADKYIQTYCCSQIRSMYEDYLNDVYAGLDGLIFAHTCDSMQSFHDIVRKNSPDLFVRNLNFPTRIDNDIAFRYAVAETKRFIKQVEEFRGEPIKKEDIEDSIALYNRNRELLDKLYSLHLSNPGEIKSSTLLHSVLASMYLDKREINSMLSTYLGTFDNGTEDSSKKRIMLVGSININDEIYTLADEFGAIIAEDDMCTGRRYFSTLVLEPTIEGIVRRYFSRPHCAAKHRDIHSRPRYISELAKKKKVDAVIFLYLKFCDPHSFDYPDIKAALDKIDLPSQLIEIEQSGAPSGQLRTKIQAFIEMLG